MTLARASGVSARFGRLTAVDSVSLAVERGEVLGLLGANGAGKTTLIRLLLGLERPSGGAVSLFGRPPSAAGRRAVGYVPQTLGLYDDLTVAENWQFVGAAFGRRGAPLDPGVAEYAERLVGSLPLGVQRRVAFAVALSHRPALLVLDEPTSGVGPLGRARLWQEIRQAAEAGTGALVTTHNMEEAEQCDRLVVMVDGSVAVEGTVAEVVGDRTVTEVEAADWRRPYGLLDGAGLPVQVQGRRLRVGAGADVVTGVLSEAGVAADVRTVPASLEEAFVALVTAG